MSGLHPVLEEAIDDLGIADDVGALATAAKDSELRIEEGRDFLKSNHPLPSELDVVVVGWTGRRERQAEATGDLDYFVVAYGLPEDPTNTRAPVKGQTGQTARW